MERPVLRAGHRLLFRKIFFHLGGGISLKIGMPGRLLPLVTGEIYHVFNRGIDHRPTFTSKSEYQRAMSTLQFYQRNSSQMKLSHFLTLARDKRQIILEKATQLEKLLEFLSFNLMPNHFHLLVRQKKDAGTSKFMSDFQNSFTRFSNTIHERVGPLFVNRFKAVRIETTEQLLHVSRYIHLNPYSSFVVKNLNELENYPWSSLPEYLDQSDQNICEKETIFSFFKNRADYRKFVFDRADYQRKLETIKHLVLES